MIVNCKKCGKDLTKQAFLLLESLNNGKVKQITCDCWSKNEHNEEDNYKN